MICINFDNSGCYYLDINECESGSPVCDENAVCNNTDGSFECSCVEGYSGSGDIGDCTGMCVHYSVWTLSDSIEFFRY